MKTENIIIIIPVIFSLTMLISGFISYKFPLAWERRTQSLRYPRYDRKCAMINKTCWNMAQRVYGKLLMIAGLINMVCSPVLVWVLMKVLKKWASENITVPAIIILCIPSACLTLLVNRKTELEMSKMAGLE